MKHPEANHPTAEVIATSLQNHIERQLDKGLDPYSYGAYLDFVGRAIPTRPLTPPYQPERTAFPQITAPTQSRLEEIQANRLNGSVTPEERQYIKEGRFWNNVAGELFERASNRQDIPHNPLPLLEGSLPKHVGIGDVYEDVFPAELIAEGLPADKVNAFVYENVAKHMETLWELTPEEMREQAIPVRFAVRQAKNRFSYIDDITSVIRNRFITTQPAQQEREKVLRPERKRQVMEEPVFPLPLPDILIATPTEREKPPKPFIIDLAKTAIKYRGATHSLEHTPLQWETLVYITEHLSTIEGDERRIPRDEVEKFVMHISKQEMTTTKRRGIERLIDQINLQAERLLGEGSLLIRELDVQEQPYVELSLPIAINRPKDTERISGIPAKMVLVQVINDLLPAISLHLKLGLPIHMQKDLGTFLRPLLPADDDEARPYLNTLLQRKWTLRTLDEIAGTLEEYWDITDEERGGIKDPIKRQQIITVMKEHFTPLTVPMESE